MSRRIEITCEKISTSHALLWYESQKKWRVSVRNLTKIPLFLSWAESFTDPFTGKLWVEEIDDSADACQRFIAEASNVKSTLLRTSGSDERRIAGTKFIQLRIDPESTGSWIMERKSKSRDNWEGFSVYEADLATSLQELCKEPVRVERILPAIKGWFRTRPQQSVE